MIPVRQLRRFFSINPLPEVGKSVCLSPSETHHLKDIIRLSVGDRCLLADGSGREVEAVIEAFSLDQQTLLKIVAIHPVPRKEDVLPLRVFQSLTKRGQIDFLIEKSQELGVDEFWPIETKRSSISISGDQRDKVLNRWLKKAIGACKQSGSLKLISIVPLRSFEEAILSIPKHETIIILHPCPKAVFFSDWISEIKKTREQQTLAMLNLFFGPEGGFADEEIEFVKSRANALGQSLRIVSLGKNILKVDTALLGVVSSLRFLF